MADIIHDSNDIPGGGVGWREDGDQALPSQPAPVMTPATPAPRSQHQEQESSANGAGRYAEYLAELDGDDSKDDLLRSPLWTAAGNLVGGGDSQEDEDPSFSRALDLSEAPGDHGLHFTAGFVHSGGGSRAPSNIGHGRTAASSVSGMSNSPQSNDEDSTFEVEKTSWSIGEDVDANEDGVRGIIPGDANIETPVVSQKSRGPLSPFSPQGRRARSGIKTINIESNQRWSLLPCRKVSVLVRVKPPAAKWDRSKRRVEEEPSSIQLGILPILPTGVSTGVSGEGSAPATGLFSLAAAFSSSAVEGSYKAANSLVVISPTAFGTKIQSDLTMETAKLVAEVGNIDSEDWARRYRFDDVLWPEVSSSGETPIVGAGRSDRTLVATAKAMVGDALGLAAESGLEGKTSGSNSVLCVLGGGGSGRSYTAFGRAALKRQKSASPALNPNDQNSVLDRTGFLGIVVAELLTAPLLSLVECTVSLLEIVKDDAFRDLFSRPDAEFDPGQPRLRHPDHRGAVVQNLSELSFKSVQDLELALAGAFASSSFKISPARGHVLATVKVKSARSGDVKKKETLIQVIDLSPGDEPDSEAEQSESTRAQTRRAAAVRQSLSALRGILRAIIVQEAQLGMQQNISYRECALTKLLQRALDSVDSRAVLVACVDPVREAHHETVQALNFVNRLWIKPGLTAQSPFEMIIKGASDEVGKIAEHPSSTSGLPAKPSKDEDLSAIDDSNTLLEKLREATGPSILASIVSDPRQRVATLLKSSSKNSRRGLNEVPVSKPVAEPYSTPPPFTSPANTAGGTFDSVLAKLDALESSPAPGYCVQEFSSGKNQDSNLRHDQVSSKASLTQVPEEVEGYQAELLALEELLHQSEEKRSNLQSEVKRNRDRERTSEETQILEAKLKAMSESFEEYKRESNEHKGKNSQENTNSQEELNAVKLGGADKHHESIEIREASKLEVFRDEIDGPGARETALANELDDVRSCPNNTMRLGVEEIDLMQGPIDTLFEEKAGSSLNNSTSQEEQSSFIRDNSELKAVVKALEQGVRESVAERETVKKESRDAIKTLTGELALAHEEMAEKKLMQQRADSTTKRLKRENLELQQKLNRIEEGRDTDDANHRSSLPNTGNSAGSDEVLVAKVKALETLLQSERVESIENTAKFRSQLVDSSISITASRSSEVESNNQLKNAQAALEEYKLEARKEKDALEKDKTDLKKQLAEVVGDSQDPEKLDRHTREQSEATIQSLIREEEDLRHVKNMADVLRKAQGSDLSSLNSYDASLIAQIDDLLEERMERTMAHIEEVKVGEDSRAELKADLDATNETTGKRELKRLDHMMSSEDDVEDLKTRLLALERKTEGNIMELKAGEEARAELKADLDTANDTMRLRAGKRLEEMKASDDAIAALRAKLFESDGQIRDHARSLAGQVRDMESKVFDDGTKITSLMQDVEDIKRLKRLASEKAKRARGFSTSTGYEFSAKAEILEEVENLRQEKGLGLGPEHSEQTTTLEDAETALESELNTVLQDALNESVQREHEIKTSDHSLSFLRSQLEEAYKRAREKETQREKDAVENNQSRLLKGREHEKHFAEEDEKRERINSDGSGRSSASGTSSGSDNFFLRRIEQLQKKKKVSHQTAAEMKRKLESGNPEFISFIDELKDELKEATVDISTSQSNENYSNASSTPSNVQQKLEALRYKSKQDRKNKNHVEQQLKATSAPLDADVREARSAKRIGSESASTSRRSSDNKPLGETVRSLTSEHDILLRENEDLAEQVKNLRKNLIETQEKTMNAMSKYEAIRLTKEETERQLSTSETRIKEQREEMRAMTSRNDIALFEIRKEATSVEERLKKRISITDFAHSERVALLEGQNEDLAQDLRDSQKGHEAVLKELAIAKKLQAEMDTASGELSKTKKQGILLENENTKLLEKILSQREEMTHLKKAMADLHDDNANMEKRLATTMKQNDEFLIQTKSLKEELETLSDEFSIAQKVAHTEKEQKDAIRREMKSLRKEVEDHQLQTSISQKEAFKLKEENDDLHRRISFLQGDEASLRNQNIALKASLKECNDTIESMGEEVSKIKISADTAIARLTAKKQSSEKMLKSVIKDLEDQLSEARAYAESNATLRAEIVHLESRLQDSSTRLEKVQSELRMTNERLQGISDDRDELNEQLLILEASTGRKERVNFTRAATPDRGTRLVGEILIEELHQERRLRENAEEIAAALARSAKRGGKESDHNPGRDLQYDADILVRTESDDEHQDDATYTAHRRAMEELDRLRPVVSNLESLYELKERSVRDMQVGRDEARKEAKKYKALALRLEHQLELVDMKLSGQGNHTSRDTSYQSTPQRTERFGSRGFTSASPWKREHLRRPASSSKGSGKRLW